MLLAKYETVGTCTPFHTAGNDTASLPTGTDRLFFTAFGLECRLLCGVSCALTLQEERSQGAIGHAHTKQACYAQNVLFNKQIIEVESLVLGDRFKEL